MKQLLYFTIALTYMTTFQVFAADDKLQENPYKDRSHLQAQPESPLLSLPDELLENILSYESRITNEKPFISDFVYDDAPFYKGIAESIGPVCVRFELMRRRAPSVQVLAHTEEEVFNRVSGIPFRYMKLTFITTQIKYHEICNLRPQLSIEPFIVLPTPLHHSLKDLGIRICFTGKIRPKVKEGAMHQGEEGCMRMAAYTNRRYIDLLTEAANATLNGQDLTCFLDMANLFCTKFSGKRFALNPSGGVSGTGYRGFHQLGNQLTYKFPEGTPMTELGQAQGGEKYESLRQFDLDAACNLIMRELALAKENYDNAK